MRLGGIFEQIGLGFHRYSTDKRWLLPHFEKMLYDQAMLSMAYLEAFQLTKNTKYSKGALQQMGLLFLLKIERNSGIRDFLKSPKRLGFRTENGITRLSYSRFSR